MVITYIERGLYIHTQIPSGVNYDICMYTLMTDHLSQCQTTYSNTHIHLKRLQTNGNSSDNHTIVFIPHSVSFQFIFPSIDYRHQYLHKRGKMQASSIVFTLLVLGT